MKPVIQLQFANREPQITIARRRDGLMLIECLVYIGLWLTVMGFAFGMFYHAYVNSKQLARNADDMVRVLKAGERWRADVRAARPPQAPTDSPIEEDGEVTLPQVSGWVKYLSEDGRVLRRSPTDPDWREILNGVKSSRMVLEDRGGVAAWRWELELLTHAERPVVRPLFTFLAVPRMEATP